GGRRHAPARARPAYPAPHHAQPGQRRLPRRRREVPDGRLVGHGIQRRGCRRQRRREVQPQAVIMTRKACTIVGALIACLLAIAAYAKGGGAAWTAAELSVLRGLSIASLPPLPPDPSNRVADDRRAAELGQQLFFDKRLSANGQVACASCHLPNKQF